MKWNLTYTLLALSLILCSISLVSAPLMNNPNIPLVQPKIISGTGDNSTWNESLADSKYALIGAGGGDNSTWNESLADTKYIKNSTTANLTGLILDSNTDADMFMSIDSGVTSDVYNTGIYLKGNGTTKWGIFKDSSNNLRFRQYVGVTTDPFVIDDNGNAYVLGTLTAVALTTGGTVNANGGSIKSSTGAISFDNENLTTTGNITATNFCNATICKDLSQWGGSTDLTGYAQYQFSSNNFNGSGNFITTGLINSTIITATDELIIDKFNANTNFRFKISGVEKGSMFGFVADNDIHFRATQSNGRMILSAGGSNTDGLTIHTDGSVDLGANKLNTTGEIHGGTRRLYSGANEYGTIFLSSDDLKIRATGVSGELFLTAGGSATDGCKITATGSLNCGDNIISTTGSIAGGSATLGGNIVLNGDDGTGVSFRSGDAIIYHTADDDNIHFDTSIGTEWIFTGSVRADDYLYNSNIFDNSESTALNEILKQKDTIDSKTGLVTHSNYSSQIYQTKTSKSGNITTGVSVSAMDSLLKQGIVELYNENQMLKSYKTKTENCLLTSPDFAKYKGCMGGMTL